MISAVSPGFKKSLLRLERVVLYLNFIFAALLLVSDLSATISPHKFWQLAFFGLIYPILFGINLFFCIYWLVRIKRFFFISAISITAGLNVLFNSFGFSYFHKTLPSPSKAHLKLMTYNVHNFQSVYYPVVLPAYHPILELIGSQQPDIIGFEEFISKNSYFRICDSLMKILHTSQFYFEPFIKTRADSTGLALFSKYPIIHRGVISFSTKKKDNPGIYIDVNYKSTIIRVYDFHLHSLEFDAGDYYILNNLRHRSAVTVSGLKKIFDKLKQGFIIRGQQADLIRQHASKCPYPFVFMGDFNDTPCSYTFNTMATGMKNTFEEQGKGLGTTFNGGFASFQLDYILVSQQFQVLDHQIIHKAISDHYPVCADVVLN